LHQHHLRPFRFAPVYKGAYLVALISTLNKRKVVIVAEEKIIAPLFFRAISRITATFSKSRSVLPQADLTFATGFQRDRRGVLSDTQLEELRKGGALRQNPVQQADVRSADFPSKPISNAAIVSTLRKPLDAVSRPTLPVNKPLPALSDELKNLRIAESLATLEGHNGLGAHEMPSWPSSSNSQRDNTQRRQGMTAFEPAVAQLEGLRELSPKEAAANFKNIRLLGGARPLPSWIMSSPERGRQASAQENSSFDRSSSSSVGSGWSPSSDAYSTRPASVASSISSVSSRGSMVVPFKLDTHDAKPTLRLQQPAPLRQADPNSAKSTATTQISVGKAEILEIAPSIGRSSIETGKELTYLKAELKQEIIQNGPRQKRIAEPDPGIGPSDNNTSGAHSSKLQTLMPTKYGGEQVGTSSRLSLQNTRIKERPDDRSRGPESR
jgi:hypothetical protein